MAKKSWTVILRVVVTKELCCDDCTEEEARKEPFEHATDEREIEQLDWEVKSVTENK